MRFQEALDILITEQPSGEFQHSFYLRMRHRSWSEMKNNRRWKYAYSVDRCRMLTMQIYDFNRNRWIFTWSIFLPLSSELISDNWEIFEDRSETKPDGFEVVDPDYRVGILDFNYFISLMNDLPILLIN